MFSRAPISSWAPSPSLPFACCLQIQIPLSFLPSLTPVVVGSGGMRIIPADVDSNIVDSETLSLIGPVKIGAVYISLSLLGFNNESDDRLI